MGERTARGWEEHNDAERWTRETEQAVHRVCEKLSGTCVMMHECRNGPTRHHDPCTPTNCAAYRAAFTHSSGDNNG